MIEFAPNPSGPSHLGTARTYLSAWKLAKESGQKLSVRFDGETLALSRSGDGRQPTKSWAEMFLDEMNSLGLKPDIWTYLDSGDLITVDTLRDDVVEAPWVHPSVVIQSYAYLPLEAPVPMPSTVPADWKEGQGDPIFPVKETTAFLYAMLPVEGKWTVTPVISHAIMSQIRGVSVIVRSHISERVTLSEVKFSEALGIPHSYDAIHEAVVVSDEGALTKHLMNPLDQGTLGWAVKNWGKEEVLEKLQHSLDADDRHIIHFEDII